MRTRRARVPSARGKAHTGPRLTHLLHKAVGTIAALVVDQINPRHQSAALHMHTHKRQSFHNPLGRINQLDCWLCRLSRSPHLPPNCGEEERASQPACGVSLPLPLEVSERESKRRCVAAISRHENVVRGWVWGKVRSRGMRKGGGWGSGTRGADAAPKQLMARAREPRRPQPAPDVSAGGDSVRKPQERRGSNPRCCTLFRLADDSRAAALAGVQILRAQAAYTSTLQNRRRIQGLKHEVSSPPVF